MNLTKARDYFSDYFEGTLDRGLKQSFEARLREDAQLQAEYKAFERTMQSLAAFGHAEVEPPSDLHDRIAARLDRAVWEQKHEKTSRLSLNWWRGLTMLGVAAAALLIVFVGMKQANNGTNQASLIGASADAPRFSFTAHAQTVTVSYPQVNHQTITFRSDGKILDSYSLDHQGLDRPFTNGGDKPSLLSVEVAEQSGSTNYIAIPGKTVDPSVGGRGSVLDLATAVAGHYQEPVVVQIGDSALGDVSWNFGGSDPVAAAADALGGLGFVATQDQSGGFISITKN